MKKAFIAFILVLAGLSTQAQTPKSMGGNGFPVKIENRPHADPTAQALDFKNAEYNFGKITLGKPVSYVVEITNISKDTITLENAHAGCGCTTPNFIPMQKFGPGQTVKVNIGFNGSVSGPFTRFTDISFSGGLSKQVRFSGEGVTEAQPAPAATLTNLVPVKVGKN